MNQQALASVLLRVYGIYILFSTVEHFSSALLVFAPSWHLTLEGGNSFWAFVGGFGFIRLGIGLTLTIAASKISRRLFPENVTISQERILNEPVLLQIGICLLGLWFFVSNLPSFLLQGLAWFQANASDSSPLQGATHAESLHEAPIPYLQLPHLCIMMILSIILIFRGKTLSTYLFKSSK